MKTRLKNLREDNDLTQTKISNYLNISQVAYSYYELGKRNIPIELLSKLADYYNTNELVKLVCSITSFTFFILAMVFYYQIHKTRITYTEQNFSIFEYFGYSEKTVKRATVIYFMLYISFVYFVSVLVSSSIAMLLNQLIINSSLLPFSLFVIDQHWILLILVIIWILAFFEGVLLNKTRKKKGWFYLIKEKSDLL